MSPFSVLCVCVAAVLVPAVSARRGVMSKHQLELKEHFDHISRISDFECNEPQPRLLTINELLSDLETRGKAFFPEVTVLHRCDRHVGSCNSAIYQCGPTHTLEVKVPFKVTYLETMGGHAKGQWQMKYYPLHNHTACGCLKYNIPPPKETVHYHYVVPEYVPTHTTPLEPNNQDQKNETSHNIPTYQSNDTQQPPRNESVQESGWSYAKPNPQTSQVDDNPIVESSSPSTQTWNSEYPTYVEFSDVSSTTPKTYLDTNCDHKDGDYTTIPTDMIRLGSWD